jgi:hypothetical protein
MSACILSTVSCRLLFGLDEEAAVCKHATPPPPLGDELSSGESRDVFVELSSLDFGETYSDEGGKRQPERNVGYDLDGTCTTNTGRNDPLLNQGSSCRQVADWIKPDYGDLAGGRDNGLRHVIENIAGFFPGFGTPIYMENLRAGKVSILLEIKDYNGKLNDSQIQVVVYTPGSLEHPPAFDGHDMWSIANDPSQPRTIDSKAYVNGGTMVATLRDLKLRLRIGIDSHALTDLEVNFVSAFFTAKIVKEEDDLWHLRKGVIAGRWRTKDLFSQIKYFPNRSGTADAGANSSAGTTKMCMNVQTYPAARIGICNAADISSEEGTPDPACDAISVGIGFEGIEAKKGPYVDLVPLENECGSQYDPANDSCEFTWEEQQRRIESPDAADQ